MGVGPNAFDSLPPRVQEAILKAQKNSEGAKQLDELKSLSTAIQVAALALEKASKSSEGSSDSAKATLEEMKGAFSNLENLEFPEIPDYATPVKKAVEGLGKEITEALSKIDVKPEFKPNIKVDQPKIPAPNVSVDLSGVEKAVKALPKAFEKAIEAIPKVDIPETDFKPLIEALTEANEKLDNISTGVRLKPQFPVSQLDAISNKVNQSTAVGNNSDGVTVGSSSTLILEANSSRIGAVITNDSDEVVYLKLGANSASLNSGIRLNTQGGTLNVNSKYKGAVYGICSSGGKVVTVEEV